MTLESLILSAEEIFHIKICVHDVSGITFADRDLSLDYEQKSHSGAYCAQAKALMGKHACMQQKLIAMRYLRSLYREGMYGICGMGVCEYVLPVVKHNQLLAVLFVGGAVQEDYQRARAKVLRRLERDGQGEGHPLLDALDAYYTGHVVSRATLLFFAQLVRDLLIEHSASLLGHQVEGSKDSTWRRITPNMELHSSWVVQAVEPYMRENFRSPLSLHQLCDLFFVTPQYLCRIFSKEMGISPMAYVNRLRVEAAAREIAATTRPLSDIGADMGISNPNYFYRLFKKTTGLTPKDYRRRSKHDRLEASAEAEQ